MLSEVLVLKETITIRKQKLSQLILKLLYLYCKDDTKVQKKYYGATFQEEETREGKKTEKDGQNEHKRH